MNPWTGDVYRTPAEVEAARARGEDVVEMSGEPDAVEELIRLVAEGNRAQRRRLQRALGRAERREQRQAAREEQ